MLPKAAHDKAVDIDHRQVVEWCAVRMARQIVEHVVIHQDQVAHIKIQWFFKLVWPISAIMRVHDVTFGIPCADAITCRYSAIWNSRLWGWWGWQWQEHCWRPCSRKSRSISLKISHQRSNIIETYIKLNTHWLKGNTSITQSTRRLNVPTRGLAK
jgi:hypothetical protein